MTQARRLGRGLEALLGHSPPPQQAYHDHAPPVSGVDAPNNGLVELSVYQIDSNPFQPRRDLDDEELEQLAQSIKEHGLLQPIVVRRVNNRYQIIAGERRLRAATKAGFEHVPAQVREADERQMAELAIIENLQRKDLNPLEKAASFQQYLQRYRCTQEELANRLKINRSTVANLIRLLELPEAVQKALRAGKLTQGHARALLTLGDEPEQIKFAKRIEKEQLSVREVEAMVKEAVKQADAEPLSVVSPDDETLPLRTRDDNLVSLEQELRAALGTRVELKQVAPGRGRIVIHFASHAEFERVRAQLNSCAALPKSQAG
jgi:ParB family chromosome partitioning protein